MPKEYSDRVYAQSLRLHGGSFDGNQGNAVVNGGLVPPEGNTLMLEKETLDNGMVRVTFRVSYEIWADRIALVGEFNDWDALLHQRR
jgi:hypothetical protein